VWGPAALARVRRSATAALNRACGGATGMRRRNNRTVRAATRPDFSSIGTDNQDAKGSSRTGPTPTGVYARPVPRCFDPNVGALLGDALRCCVRSEGRRLPGGAFRFGLTPAGRAALLAARAPD
jgi:hypothetical protein